MKKKAMMVFVLFVTAVFMPCKSFAEDISGKLGFGGNWFYYLQNDAEFDDDFFEDEDIKNKSTAEAFNLHVSYCLPQPSDVVNVNLILDWEYISRELKAEDTFEGISDDLGTLTMMPLMLGAQVRFANLGIVTPYVGFGLGISFNKISRGNWADDFEDEVERRFGWEADFDIDVDHSFAFKVPVGMDIFITDFLALNIEAKYFYTKPEAEIKFKADGFPLLDDEDEVDQSSFAFGAGISFYF